MFGLYAWMYEQESQNTSNHVKETLKTRAKKGLFKCSNPPYGYKVKEGKLYIRQDETPEVVRRIYKEYLEGSGRESAHSYKSSLRWGFSSRAHYHSKCHKQKTEETKQR